MRKVSYVVAGIILTGCGGGGGSSPTPNNSNTVPTNPTNNVVEKPYFTEVPNALKVDYPYSNTFLNLIATDINNDGRDDIVIHQMGWRNVATSVGNVPCDNVLKVFIMQPDNTFSDQTVSYIQGNNLQGCSRKIRSVDVNNDNRKDILFALNQEDGRLQASPHDMNAQNAILLSNGNIFNVRRFGIPSWYHAISHGIDSSNRVYVTGAGYTNSDINAYYFDKPENNSIALFSTMSKNNVSDLSPTTFELFSSSKNSNKTDLILQANNFYPKWVTAVGYGFTDNKWSNIGSVDLLPIDSFAKHYSFTGEYGGEGPVYKYKNYYLAFAGMSESCQLKMTPDSNTTVVFMVSGAIVPNYTPGMTIQQRGLQVISFFKAATVENNVVKEVNLNIENEVFEDNAGVIECKDVNNDGYTDIVKYPYSTDGLPAIYINTKQNSFKYYGKTNLPSTKTGWEISGKKNASSLLHDFDKDGFSDLLIYAPQDVIDVKTITYKFYKGQKPL